MAEAPNTHTVFIDPGFNAAQRRQIGEAIIAFIKRRTKAGQGPGGQALRGTDGNTRYSKSYVSSAEFKSAGKSKSGINLTLTGDMLDSIEILDISLAGRVVIGFDDQDSNDKSVWMREKGYNFLAITDEEKTLILQDFERPTSSVNISQGFARNLLRGLLGN